MNPFVQTEGIIWTAHLAWSETLGGPGAERRLFRRCFHLKAVPKTCSVSVTAEGRYVLFVNGVRVSRGPFKGTSERYYYDTVDISPHLKTGTNVLAAEVRWFGSDAPVSEVHTYRAGLVLQGPEDLDLDTPGHWLVFSDGAVSSDTTEWISNAQRFLTAMEIVELGRVPLGWQTDPFDDSDWLRVSDAGSIGNLTVWGTTSTPYLTPIEVKPLQEEELRFSAKHSVDRVVTDVSQNPVSWHLEAGSAGELILDAGALTTGFPVLSFAGGKHRTVEVVYGECTLFREGEGNPISSAEGPWFKDMRDGIATGDVSGYRDTLILDGREIVWEPFLWRTFWYIKIVVSAGDSVFCLADSTYRYTTYPVELLATFSCDRPEYADFMDMGWRTLRLCSHDTFEDCPYYEQLHYLGDARLEALAHMYLTGDTDYVKRSISLYRDSARWNGLVQSRTPSFDFQVIPYFALLWVLMVKDFWDYSGPSEKSFVQTCLHAIDGVLIFFRTRLRDDGFVGKMGPWNMVDHADEWRQGEPPAVAEGGSTYLTCLFIHAIDAAIDLHEHAGDPIDAERWRVLKNELVPRVRQGAWDPAEGLYLEGPGRIGDRASQHSQVMAILSGVATGEQITAIAERLVSDPSLISTKLMQGFYLARALERASMYEHFHSTVLTPWHEMRLKHLSTFTEYWPPGRSDCHAWSSWILVDFMRCLLGVQPLEPGFEGIRIQPQTAGMGNAEGSVPTPKGTVRIRWDRTDTGSVVISGAAPEGVPTLIVLPDGRENLYENGGDFLEKT